MISRAEVQRFREIAQSSKRSADYADYTDFKGTHMKFYNLKNYL
jgi:hypothetical protein